MDSKKIKVKKIAADFLKNHQIHGIN